MTQSDCNALNSISRRTFLSGAGALPAYAILSGSLFADGNPPGKIKIGQIGTGHSHAYKTEIMRNMTDCFEFVGIAEDNPELRKNAEKQKIYQGLRWMSSEELLAISDLQAVAVETDEYSNLAAALKCIQAGKHIHLDKPAGMSLPHFARVLDEAKKRKLTVQMGYMLRSNLSIQFCRKVIDEGLIGEIYDLDAAMCRYDTPQARKRVANYPGGAFYLLGCHLIDLALLFMGKPEKMYSFMKQTRNDGCIDNGMVVFEFSKGRLATLRSSVAEVDGFQQRQLIIRGTEGTIIVRPLETKGNGSVGKVEMTLLKDAKGFKKGYHFIDMPESKNRYEDQWRQFADVVAGKMHNPYAYEHEYNVQKYLLEACGITDPASQPDVQRV